MTVTVLVATPHTAFGELLRSSLQDSGPYKVRLAQSAKEARMGSDAAAYQLAILDSALSDEPFIPLCLDLLKRQTGLQLIVIPPDNNPNHPALGGLLPHGYLSRPFYLPDLLNLISRLMEEREKQIPDGIPEKEEEPEALLQPGPQPGLLPNFPAWLQETRALRNYLEKELPNTQALAGIVGVIGAAAGGSLSGALRACAGILDKASAEELARVVFRYWNVGQKTDLMRYIRLNGEKKDYLVYATPILGDLVLILAYDSSEPLSLKVRPRTKALAQALATLSPGESKGESPSDSKQPVIQLPPTGQPIPKDPSKTGDSIPRRAPSGPFTSPGAQEWPSAPALGSADPALGTADPALGSTSAPAEPAQATASAPETGQPEEPEAAFEQPANEKPSVELPPDLWFAEQASSSWGTPLEPAAPDLPPVESPTTEALASDWPAGEKPASDWPGGEKPAGVPADIGSFFAGPSGDEEEGQFNPDLINLSALLGAVPPPDPAGDSRAGALFGTSWFTESSPTPASTPIPTLPGGLNGNPAPDGRPTAASWESRTPASEPAPAEKPAKAELSPDEAPQEQDPSEKKTGGLPLINQPPGAVVSAPYTQDANSQPHALPVDYALPPDSSLPPGNTPEENTPSQPRPASLDVKTEAPINPSAVPTALEPRPAATQPPDDLDPDTEEDVLVPVEETRPHVVSTITHLSQLEPASPALSLLNYTCVLVPRLPQHYLTGELADRMAVWVQQLCLAFGWRLEGIAIRPEYLQWTVQVAPAISPGNLVRIVRQRTSMHVFSQYAHLADQNPSGDFWATGYLIVSGAQPPSAQLLRDFIAQTRKRQGVSK